MDRAIVYIDGFNLYFGLCDRGWRRYLWLDLAQLGARLLKPGQVLAGVKYFTARVRADAAKVQRQSTYLQALEVRGGVEIHYGRYQQRKGHCRNCNATWTEYEEKMVRCPACRRAREGRVQWDVRHRSSPLRRR